ncbi:rifin [Plasmodium sp. gorilla clade G1]|nr:rifin [Plasmodium sp. gorilla clade G1]
MKLHYSNILLLYALNINILITSSSNVNIQRNSYKTSHTPNTKTRKSHRSLCECELYAPSNYDNDSEMIKVMENFDLQTSQRFEEYNERMKEKRKQCKEQCDNDIQKIILKDKIEKEMTEKLTALQTDITTEDIPTCICEKSLEDKIEKSCLKCEGILGTAGPELGLISGSVIYAGAVKTSMKAGIEAAIDVLEGMPGLNKLIGSPGIAKIVTPLTYNKAQSLFESIYVVKEKMCVGEALRKIPFCNILHTGKNNAFWYSTYTQEAAAEGIKAYGTTLGTETSPNAFLTNPYIASSIAIMIIVAIVLIIYLILRYRRKKKLQKKFQYIKLLKE